MSVGHRQKGQTNVRKEKLIMAFILFLCSWTGRITNGLNLGNFFLIVSCDQFDYKGIAVGILHLGLSLFY
jgi:hypothetical protein